MISAEKQSTITKVTKKKVDDIIHQLQVQPSKDNLIKFLDIVGSGIEQNLNFRFIAEKAKVVLEVDDLNTWSFLLDYFEHKGQVYPAICCAEELLLAGCNTEAKERYAQLQAIYNNKKKEELNFVQKAFKKNPPKFSISVIVPTYNRHQYIGRSIKSVLNQTFKDFELIIVNDGGSRECEKIINSFKSDKIRYFYIEHGGLSYALNQGILASRSKYIAYLDDDDRYFPEHLQILLETLESSSSYPFVYSDSYHIVKKYKNGKWSQVSKAIDISNNYNPALFTERNYIPILNIMHRRDCLKQIGLFEENFPNVMDWDLWYKASRFYDFKHINKVTSEFEHRLDSDSSLSGRQLDHLFYSILLYRHHQHLVKHVWNDLSERSDLKFLNYIELENKISRYSKDELQLGEWLLPYAFAERKFFHAYKLARKMILNDFKKAFPRVWKLVPKISVFNKIIILLFIFLILSEKFFKYLVFNITSMFRKNSSINN